MCKIISINKITDRILARMQVREAARSLRFDLKAQARISLAAYNVICSMGMGMTSHGEVLVNQLLEGERQGIQVVCTASNTNGIPTSFSDARWLVDGLNVEEMSPNNARVVMVIWAS